MSEFNNIQLYNKFIINYHDNISDIIELVPNKLNIKEYKSDQDYITENIKKLDLENRFYDYIKDAIISMNYTGEIPQYCVINDLEVILVNKLFNRYIKVLCMPDTEDKTIMPPLLWRQYAGITKLYDIHVHLNKRIYLCINLYEYNNQYKCISANIYFY